MVKNGQLPTTLAPPTDTAPRTRGLTSDQRQQIVKECVEDRISPSDLAKKWGCSPDSIRTWVRKSGQNLPESYKKPSKPESFFRHSEELDSDRSPSPLQKMLSRKRKSSGDSGDGNVKGRRILVVRKGDKEEDDLSITRTTNLSPSKGLK